MKYAFFSALLLSSLILSSAAMAADTVPFGDRINLVKNYNRTTPTIATGGILYDGAAKQLQENGFKTVLDIRTLGEGVAAEKKVIEAAGMSYINLEVSGGTATDDAIVEQFSKWVDAAEKPMLIHCGSANRVGTLWAQYLMKKGVSTEYAIQEGITVGMKPVLEEKLRSKIK